MFAAPFVFVYFNKQFKWVTHRYFSENPDTFFILCLAFILWPIGLLLLVYNLGQRKIIAYLPQDPPSKNDDRYY